MTANRILFPAISRVCSAAIYQLRHESFDTAKVFREISAARFQLFSERKNIKYASAFSVVLDRCEVLYFSLVSAHSDMAKLVPPFIGEVYLNCSKIAISTFMLFDKIPNPDDRRSFLEKSEIILSQLECFTSEARSFRFKSLTNHGSISRALPEIEYICKCTKACERAERLIHAYSGLISYI